MAGEAEGRKGVTKRRTHLKVPGKNEYSQGYKVLGETLKQGVVVDTAFEIHIFGWGEGTVREFEVHRSTLLYLNG